MKGPTPWPVQDSIGWKGTLGAKFSVKEAYLMRAGHGFQEARIWKVERGSVLDRSCWLKQADQWVACWNNQVQRSERTQMMATQTWLAPSVGWWKVNTDGSHLLGSGASACGGVIRDCDGRWIRVFTKAIGQCSILEAELWGVHVGLEVAWSLGCRKLLVELDNQDAIRIMQQRHGCSGVSSLVNYIQEALQRPWEVVVQYVPRTSNMVADRIAKMAHHASMEIVVLE
ncbi:hypothetical protein V6N11_076642 [Hibiscus sabdariffa]|uniref:RNase H type-1 domain-containing protein n=2 Tax=Hibiscus sabdariffa TaxID=183260 RepID=A0ABR2Q6V7_9ROSI